MSKVTIIGTGAVGASICYAMSLKGTASEIVLIDINERKAEGEELDIRQGMPYSPQNKIYAGTYEDAVGSDVVVITSGVPRKTVSTVMTVSGIAFSCVLGGLFVFTCFHKVNISLLFFALFALFGTVGVSREAKYVRLFDGSFSKVLKRGGTVRRIAVAETVTVKRLIILLDCKALNEVCVYDRAGNLTDTVSEKELLTILSGENLYKTVGEALREENKTI